MELTIDQINKKINDFELGIILDKSDIVQTVHNLSKSFNKTIDNIKSKVIKDIDQKSFTTEIIGNQDIMLRHNLNSKQLDIQILREDNIEQHPTVMAVNKNMVHLIGLTQGVKYTINIQVVNHMLRFVLQYKDWNYVINNKYDFDIFVDSVWEKIWTRQDILKLQKIAFQLV